MAILEEQNPAQVLADLTGELHWLKRLHKIPGIRIPDVHVKTPRPDLLFTVQQFELCVRWEREVAPGCMKRFGANFNGITDREVMLLSKAAIKERLEAWFQEVLRRARVVV